MKLEKHSLQRVVFWALAAVLALGATIQNGYPQVGGPPGGDVLALAIDPSTPATLYAGFYGGGGGVFKSTNGGTSWTAVNSGLTATPVVALAIDPSTPATLYAGSGIGVFKSTNGGTSWTAVNSGLPTNAAVNALAIEPSTPATLYAGTSGGGVFKSTNGGASWIAVNSGLTATQVNVLAIDPSTPATLYAGTGGGGVFKSTNGGASWTAVNSGLPTNTSVSALAIDPSTPATLYAVIPFGGVRKSTNGGTSWTLVDSGLPMYPLVWSLVVDPSTPATLYAGSNPGGVSKSTNGGTSWTYASSGLTNIDILALAIDPSTPATLYAGTYGGVFKSANGGTSWQPTGTSSGNGAPPATTISKVSGDNQTGAAGQPLRYPFVAVVTNASGIPVAGVSVNFTITAGFVPMVGGVTLSGTQSTTDSQGVAFTTLILGSSGAANYTVTATAAGLTGSPLTFTATATAPSGPTVTNLATLSPTLLGLGLATDGTNFYLTGTLAAAQPCNGAAQSSSSCLQGVFKVPVSGGPPALLYAAFAPRQVAVANGKIFWIDPDAGPVTDTEILSAPASGAGPVSAIYVGANVGQPILDGSGLSTDGAKLYAADAVSGNIFSANFDGSALIRLNTSSRYDNGFNGKHPQTIVWAAGTIYVADIAGGVFSLPATGGSFTPLAVGAPLMCPHGIAAGNGNLYVTDPCAGNTIWAIPISGGTPTALWAGTPFLNPEDILFLNNSLYVLDGGNTSTPGTLYQINLYTPISAPNPLPNGTVGSDYWVALGSPFGPRSGFAVTSGSLPPGLSLFQPGGPTISTSIDAHIVGIPTSPGVFTFTIQVSSGSGTATATYSITVSTLVLNSLSPSSASGGGPAFNLSLNGSGFLPNSVVQWNGTARATTFVSSTQLMAAISATDIASVGTAQVTVTIPGISFSYMGGVTLLPVANPASAVSNALPFTIIPVTAPNTSGIITTVAGNGTTGFSGDGGPAISAELASPGSVAVDLAGNLYIADTTNQRIRRVTSDGIISTVAGNGCTTVITAPIQEPIFPITVGCFSGDGGPATSAGLSNPIGVAVDLAGNLYIADTINQRIRRVTPDGIISTVAGNGCLTMYFNVGSVAVAGCFSGDGGPATGAELSNPDGIALDSTGNLYISDVGNGRIRKVTPSGTITTIAGNGPGFSGDGGPATSAEFYVAGVALDSGGNLYTADPVDHLVREVTAAGIVRTVAGDGTPGFSGDGGPATEAELFSPMSVTVDSAGNLYIADALTFRIRKVTPAGIISTVAGGGSVIPGDGSPATNAQLNGPVGVAVDSAGNIYIADANRIRKVTASTNSPTIFVSPTSLSFSAIQGGSNPTSQTVTISNSGGGTLSWVTGTIANSGGAWLSVSPASGTNTGTLTVSVNISSLAAATYNGTVQVTATTASNTPQNIAVQLTVSAPSATADLAITMTESPNPMAPTGSVTYTITVQNIGSASANNVTVIDTLPAGLTFVGCVNSTGGACSQTSPGIVTVSLGTVATSPFTAIVTIGASNIGPPVSGFLVNTATVSTTSLEANTANNTVSVTTTVISTAPPPLGGTITTIAGTGTAGYSGDGGPGTSAQVNQPQRMALDADGNVYFADTGNHRVRKITPAGLIVTVAGNGIASYSGDGGAAASASLNSPRGVAADAGGNLYIADSGNGRIRKVSPQGIISTVRASLAFPVDVAVDSAGAMYIANYSDATILQVEVTGTVNTLFQGKPLPNPCINPSTCQASLPTSLALDASGNLYFGLCDYTDPFLSYGIIEELTSVGGATRTIAGVGPSGSSGDGGLATATRLQCSDAITLDLAGNLYIAELADVARVRVVDRAGIIRTVAGGGSASPGDGGLATSAKLGIANGVAVDAAGDLYIADFSDNRIRKVSTVKAPGGPAISNGGVVNGASFAAAPAPVAPGSIISVFGTNLATDTGAAASLPLPTTILGAQLLINGVAAPLFFASPGQINAQVPWEVRGAGTISAQVVMNGTSSNTLAVNLADAAPGIFTLGPSSQGAVVIGSGEFAAPTGSIFGGVVPARPVKAGEVISIYITGLGPVSGSPVTGVGAPTDSLSTTSSPPTVTIGGVPAQVSFSGLSPNFVGLYQVNAQVPQNAPAGNAVPLKVNVGNAASNTVVIAVAPG